jgi:glyoxylase-like metal-dependent hydrolase (beta-lactamase superfamily II)
MNTCTWRPVSRRGSSLRHSAPEGQADDVPWALRALAVHDVPVKVADGIDMVEGLRVGNAYLVRGAEGLLLVDSGTPGSAKRILASIARIGANPSDLRYIVLTHWHPDHMGGVAELKRQTGAQVSIHELDAPVLAGRERPAKGRRTMGLLLRVFRVAPLVADVALRSGDVIGGLEVIHVPGQTAGSIALRRADGVVLSGDALLGDRHGRLRQPDPGLSLDPDQALASAAMLRSLEPRMLLPGHGAPVRG